MQWPEPIRRGTQGGVWVCLVLASACLMNQNYPSPKQTPKNKNKNKKTHKKLTPWPVFPPLGSTCSLSYHV